MSRVGPTCTAARSPRSQASLPKEASAQVLAEGSSQQLVAAQGPQSSTSSTASSLSSAPLPAATSSLVQQTGAS